MLEEFEKQSVKKLINSYDYAAAYSIARDSGMFTDKFKELISAAAARLKLESKARTVFQKHGITGIFTNTKYHEFADIEEYLLLIKIKIKKEEYADFLRSITPAIYELFQMYLKFRCGFDISEYTYADKKGVLKWEISKLDEANVLKG